MTPQQAVQILRRFNKWRTADYGPDVKPSCPNPVEITKAITIVCDELARVLKRRTK